MSESGTGSVGPASTSNSSSDTAPAMLIRTLQGHITFWSPAMEQRYGFSSGEALGRVAHELLRTIIWTSQQEIEATLVERKSWTGGFLHRRSDGRLVMTAHHWHMHKAGGQDGPLLSELHSDVTVTDAHGAVVLADIIGGIGQELSQPLTVVSNYLSGASRLSQMPWPDEGKSSRALAVAAEQVDRIREGMGLFRHLGEMLRPPNGCNVTRRTELAARPAASESMEVGNHRA
jgi:PAS domain S-box-containing protein